MKRGFSMILTAAMLLVSPALADEETSDEKQVQKSESASIRINVNSSTKNDGDESESESVVSGRIVIVGPDGEKKEYDLNDKLPEGFEQLILPGATGGNRMSLLFENDEEAEERFMIGVGCEPASDVLRNHLHLGETGLLVTQVSEKLPAAGAGIESGDILLAAGDRKLTSLQDLIDVVTASEGEAISFSVMKAGMKEEVEITPRKTTASMAAVGFPKGLERIFLSDDDNFRFDIDMEEFEDKLQNSRGNFIIRRLGPGIRMPGEMDEALNDLNIRNLIGDAVEDVEVFDLSAEGSEELRSELQKMKKRLAAMEKKFKAMKKATEEK